MGCEACRELRTQLVTRRCCVTEFPGQGSTPLQLFRLLYKWREWLAYESEFLGEIGFRNNGIQEFNSCSKSPSLGIVTLLSFFLFVHRPHPLLLEWNIFPALFGAWPRDSSSWRPLHLGSPLSHEVWRGCVSQEDPGMEEGNGTGRREYISNYYSPHF